MRTPGPEEIGAISRLRPEDVLSALAQPQAGRIYDLDPGRYPGMPQWNGHPTYTLLSYRTPAGIKMQGDVPLFAPANNPAGIGILTELMVSSMHVGAHVDALCHIVNGAGEWFGGLPADQYCSDFGPTRLDAASIPPMVLKAVLLDAAGYQGRPHLEPGSRLDPPALKAIVDWQKMVIPTRSCVLIRTGIMGLWGDPSAFAAADGAGPDLDAARWLIDDCDALLLGSDTTTVEQIPSSTPGNPHPVHDFALRQRGVHLLELAYLEELARDRVYEFTLICLPLKIHGATGSMVRPIAIA